MLGCVKQSLRKRGFMSTTLSDEEQKLVDAIVKHSDVQQYGNYTIVISPNHVRVSAMYTSPIEQQFAFMCELSELFGTKDINIGEENRPGCTTCDHGSSYGVILHFNKPKNLKDIRSLIISNDPRELRYALGDHVPILMTTTIKNHKLVSVTYEPYTEK